MYRSVVFHFLSGTGNSFRAAHWMAEEARVAGAEARVMPIDGIPPDAEVPSGPQTLLGLFFPTHGFITPWLMLRFAIRLPRGKGTHAVVVPTRAGIRIGPFCIPGMEGTAGWLPALILALKGYRLRGVMGLDMPSNWLSLHWGLGAKSVEMITSRAEPKARRFMNVVLAGGARFRGFIPLLLGLLLLPVSVLYLALGRFFLAKLFFADDRCTGCRFCARHCPARAILMLPRDNPRPFWTFSCESCMRCMAFCPEHAVQAGHSWGALLYFLTAATGFDWLLNRIIPGVLPDTLWTAILVEYPLTLLAIGLAYSLFFRLMRIPAVNTFFARTTLTRYWRRYREPHTRMGDMEVGWILSRGAEEPAIGSPDEHGTGHSGEGSAAG